MAQAKAAAVLGPDGVAPKVPRGINVLENHKRVIIPPAAESWAKKTLF